MDPLCMPVCCQVIPKILKSGIGIGCYDFIFISLPLTSLSNPITWLLASRFSAKSPLSSISFSLPKAVNDRHVRPGMWSLLAVEFCQVRTWACSPLKRQHRPPNPLETQKQIHTHLHISYMTYIWRQDKLFMNGIGAIRYPYLKKMKCDL